jgi:pimeloyl-ACP methyl ester carboxylesterase
MFAVQSFAEPALKVLGKDFTFPNKIAGLPSKLSDFKELQINTFQTSDGVKLTYWEAGKGQPLVFVPGWSGNGAEYINILYLLSQQYHMYVLDPRNQGLSQRVEYGNRIARFAVDLKEFADHLGLKSAVYCGHSMGASVIWSYIDLFGTRGIRKAVFIDEPISIAARPEWTEAERRDFGALVPTPEILVALLSGGVPPPASSSTNNKPLIAFGPDTPYFVNSQSFAHEFIKNDPAFMIKVMYDHGANDWHDVIQRKINVPTAIFTGEFSGNLPSQHWMHKAIPNATLFVYSKEESGDHVLMLKNPVKFTTDLQSFLKR